MNVIRWMMDFYDKKRNPIKYAKRIGVKIGNDCKLNGSPNWGSEPYLISLGDHTEVSFDCAFITHDGATWGFRNQERYKGVIRFGRIRVGDNVFIAPNCGFYTAGHPLDIETRNKGLEYGKPIKIGNNVWIGGNVVVLPGVTIGDNVTIGAGSVVTKDIPSNTVAHGNPCKIVKNI